MVEDRDSERLTDVVDAVGPLGPDDDDPIGMRVVPGLEVGGYVIDGELGHGGMGVVYSATHPVIGKRAAIKILRPEVSRSPVAVERFIQEARAVNQIGHPNIVDIFAYGALPDGRAYHVMDLLVGESLRRRLKRDVLHPSEAASVIDEIAQALSAAHEHGFVHRDLKPDNVFLVGHDGRWPEVKLLDFGLAKLMPEHGVAAFTTKTGVMLGTPEYMSPEQARGTGVDYRTDVYALGIVMFEILAGARPFPPMGDPLATLMQHAEEPPTSLADVVAGLPDEMVQLVAAMLAKTPGARPSLAAVRTVIKRLRTTQLPSRSVAGLALASFSQLPARPLGITPSRVGAEAVLPGDSRMSGLAQPTTTPGLGMDAMRTSNPSFSAMARTSASGPAPHASGRAPQASGLAPQASGLAPQASGSTLHPRHNASDPALRAIDPARQTSDPSLRAIDPARQTSDPSLRAIDPARQTSDPALRAIDPARQTSDPARQISDPALQRLRRASHPPLTASASGARAPLAPVAPSALRASPVGSQLLPRTSADASAVRMPSTTLGVAAPVIGPRPAPPAPAAPRRTWLVLALVIVLAGVLALVLALVGT